MGILGIPTRENKGNKEGNNNRARYKKGNYTNEDAVENVLHYVTRTRENEERGDDLINYGAVGADYFHSVDNMIQQFRYVQYVYGINSRRGRRMYHEVLNLKDCEFERLGRNPEVLWQVGMECCQVYFQMGHQAVFAVHWEPEKRCHIHFAVNTINFQNGWKWHTTLPEIIDKIHKEKLELDGLLKEVWVRGDEKQIPDVKIKNKWKLQETDIILMYQNKAVFGTMFGGKGFVLTNSLLCNLNPSMTIPLAQISDISYDDVAHAISVSGDGSEIIIDLNSGKPASRRFLYSCLQVFFETYYMSQEERHMRFVKRCAKKIWEIMEIYAAENNLSKDDACDLLIQFLIGKGIIKEKSQTIFCPYCGKKIIRTIKFCNYCGKANKNG